MSSSWPATIRFSRPFSSRSRRNSLASSAFIPPYWLRQQLKVCSLISSAWATLGDGLAPSEQPVRLAELADDLLRSVLSAFHFGSSLPSRAMVEPSYQMDQFSGVRSMWVPAEAPRSIFDRSDPF
jgi:hypothetical protein